MLLKKNQLEEVLVEQTIKFELNEPEPPGRTCTATACYFHDKIKTFKKYLRMDYFIIYC